MKDSMFDHILDTAALLWHLAVSTPTGICVIVFVLAVVVTAVARRFPIDFGDGDCGEVGRPIQIRHFH